MTLADLQTLLDFHYWARDRTLEALDALSPDDFIRPLGGSFGSIRDTLVHIYSGDWVWYERWSGGTPTHMVEAQRFADVESVRHAWADLEEKTRALVARLGERGIQAKYEFRTMDGRPQSQVFWHMAQHVVNHGTYHRGQLTTLLRQVGARPPRSTDLIAYYRERQGV